MVKYLVVFLMVMLAIANGYGGSKEADNARARLFASISQLGKTQFLQSHEVSSCQQCDPVPFFKNCSIEVSSIRTKPRSASCR
ncbi:hypothetical protein WN944_010845 [Citrus x changshan-huyou]|uniref:Uncharacterized protein n=1 Tax=Citrus x changshan-huyou TaxID=2935761 RepID=A0AAP0MUW3_9ROSI